MYGLAAHHTSIVINDIEFFPTRQLKNDNGRNNTMRRFNVDC